MRLRSRTLFAERHRARTVDRFSIDRSTHARHAASTGGIRGARSRCGGRPSWAPRSTSRWPFNDPGVGGVRPAQRRPAGRRHVPRGRLSRTGRHRGRALHGAARRRLRLHGDGAERGHRPRPPARRRARACAWPGASTSTTSAARTCTRATWAARCSRSTRRCRRRRGAGPARIGKRRRRTRRRARDRRRRDAVRRAATRSPAAGPRCSAAAVQNGPAARGRSRSTRACCVSPPARRAPTASPSSTSPPPIAPDLRRRHGHLRHPHPLRLARAARPSAGSVPARPAEQAWRATAGLGAGC